MPAPGHLIQAFHRAWLEPERAGRTALADAERSLSYPQLHAEVGALAAALARAGVERGDRVALSMQRHVRLAVTLLAVMAAGACACVLEPRLGPQETRRRFAMTGMRWILLDASAVGDPGLDELDGVRRLDLDDLEVGGHAGWCLDIDPASPGFLLFTSGSSGRPKGVLQSHRGLLANARGVMRHTGLGAGDRLLHVMPLYHTNGVNNQLLAPLWAGAAVHLVGRFRADEMPGAFERVRPTIVTGVPTMYSRMLDEPFSPGSLQSIRMLRCGSAPISEALHRRIEERFGKPLVVSYGLSEATCTSTMNPPAARRIGSVGTVLEGQDVFLLDAEGRRVTRAGADGEICIAGPALMLGYLVEGGDAAPQPVGEMLRTGDLGRFDDEGYLQITGRLKDVIIRGGENLSPNLIEGVLAKVPGVRACCVVGMPDHDLGEVPMAFVVRAADDAGRQLDEHRLGEAVVAELSRIHKPVAYRYLDQLPENAVGKVDRKALARMLAEH